jgi:hypothetical protein
MMTLSMVVEPHAAEDAAKVEALVEAYTYEMTVPPIVVLILGDAPWALSGSHRLAAMRELYDGDSDLTRLEERGLVLLVDGEPLYERGVNADRAVFDRILASRYSPADDLDTIRGLLPRAARVALEGQ